jgi:periplasmic divalent cation tolerance protein
MNINGILLLCTFPNKNLAKKISFKVIEEKMAACVNISKIESIFTWNNKIEEAVEFLTIFKTTKSKINILKDFIINNHPYEVPEIIEIKMDAVSKSYLKWLNNITR